MRGVPVDAPNVVDATMTSQNQITVPSSIRKRLGLAKGDQLRFIMLGDEIRVERHSRRPLEEVLGSLKPRSSRETTDDLDDEIEEAIEMGLRERYPHLFEADRG